MTNETDARAKVRAHLGSDDFELSEFPEGWRVIRHIPEGYRGTTTLAIERATGSLLSFASGVPPLRVERNFNAVRSHARIIEPPPEPAAQDGPD